MPTGTTLATLRAMLNAEIGAEMDETISPANIPIHNRLLNTQQRFLISQHAYLLGKVRVELPLIVGQQYYDPPGGIDFDRLDLPLFTNVNNFRYEVKYGIGQPEYNYWDSSRGLKSSPVFNWDRVLINGVKKIEVWPIPLVPQTLMLSGTALVTDMGNDTDTCVIDDLVLVLFTAARILAKNGNQDAQAVLAQAQATLNALRGDMPSKFDTFNMKGGDGSHSNLGFGGNGRRPVVATNAT